MYHACSTVLSQVLSNFGDVPEVMMRRLANGSHMIFKVKALFENDTMQDYELKVSDQPASYCQLEGTPREVLDDIMS